MWAGAYNTIISGERKKEGKRKRGKKEEKK